MAKKQSEIDARTPDAFLTGSEKFLKWVEDKSVILAVVAAVALVAGLSLIGYQQWDARQERLATTRIYEAQAALLKKQEDQQKIESDRLQKMAEEASAKKSKMPSYQPLKVDFDSTFGALAQAVEQAIIKEKSSKAALVAAIHLAGLYMNHDKVDQAFHLLSQLKGQGEGAVGALLTAQRATVAMDKGEFETAIKDFEKIVSNKDVDFLHSSALLKIGLCYEKLNQLDQARQTYLRVSTEFGDTESARTAKGYLRLLELQAEANPAEGKRG